MHGIISTTVEIAGKQVPVDASFSISMSETKVIIVRDHSGLKVQLSKRELKKIINEIEEDYL